MKAEIAALTDVPESVRSEYEPHDGKFILKLEGDTPEISKLKEEHDKLKGKITEFRDNNTRLRNELDVARTRMEAVKDIDPEEYVKAKAKVKELEDKGVRGADDVNALMAKMVKEHVDPIRKELETEKTARAEAQQKLGKAKFREIIGSAALGVGARKDALDYLLAEAEKTFIVEDGEIRARPDKYSPTKITEPITVDEWLKATASQHAFAFETSKGGGSTGSRGNGGARGKQLVDPTPQELAKYSEQIIKGEMQIVHTNGR